MVIVMMMMMAMMGYDDDDDDRIRYGYEGKYIASPNLARQKIARVGEQERKAKGSRRVQIILMTIFHPERI